MKRLILGLVLLAAVLFAANVSGLRLPWGTSWAIKGWLVNDSIWTDTSFFKHDRAGDSTYILYFTYSDGDSSRLRYLGGRDHYLTLTDTMFMSKGIIYLSGTPVEDSLVSSAYTTKNLIGDTATAVRNAVFRHDTQADSTSDIYFNNATGDTVFAAHFGGRSPFTISDSVILPVTAYRGAKHADSLLATMTFVRDSAGSTGTDTATVESIAVAKADSIADAKLADTTRALNVQSLKVDSLLGNLSMKLYWGTPTLDSVVDGMNDIHFDSANNHVIALDSGAITCTLNFTGAPDGLRGMVALLNPAAGTVPTAVIVTDSGTVNWKDSTATTWSSNNGDVDLIGVWRVDKPGVMVKYFLGTTTNFGEVP